MSGFDVSLLTPPAKYVHQPAATLAAELLGKLKQLEEHFGNDGFELLTTEGGEEKRGLDEREIMFLSRETFLRFLTATKGDASAAITRLENAVIWRRTVEIENVQKMAEDCEPESRSGKNIVMGFSPSLRPIMYFFPNRNTTPVDQRRAVHAIFMLERARDLMPAGTSNVIVVFNFAGKRAGPPTSVSVARQVLYILSNHYPETLGLSSFQNVPWLVKTFINLMWPFVDPATKAKVKFGSKEAAELVHDGDVETEYLLEDCGGELKLPYDHEAYWPAMVETCLRVRRGQDEAFKALGPARVGRQEREWRRQLEAGNVTSDAAADPLVATTTASAIAPEEASENKQGAQAAATRPKAV